MNSVKVEVLPQGQNKLGTGQEIWHVAQMGAVPNTRPRGGQLERTPEPRREAPYI